MAVHKTYGISGYIEYTAEIAVGKAHLSIHFEKGCINSHGTYPATYTSKNPIEQAIIENSPLYKQGRITIVFKREVAEEKPVGEATVTVEAQAKTPEADASGTGADAQKFASLADAKDFLQQQGVIVDAIKFKADAIEIAKANGFSIEFTR